MINSIKLLIEKPCGDFYEKKRLFFVDGIDCNWINGMYFVCNG